MTSPGAFPGISVALWDGHGYLGLFLSLLTKA